MNPPAESPFHLRGQVALITGGGTGIGLAIARAFVAHGARVVLVGRRVDELDQAVLSLGPSACALPADITQTDRTAALVAEAEQIAGPITTLVNNAGKHLKRPTVDVSEAEFLEVLNVHVTAAHALSRHVACRQLERGDGHILFIASMASLFGLPQVSAYAAAKSALLGLTRSLAAEWSPRGVRVNAIAPGWIETPMLVRAMASDPARRAKVIGRTPLGRFGTTDDIAHAAVYLSSPAARFVTGACLAVDGGASIGF
jgi:NAD(P)-dependent dehydrogenase (short-subunit alcohol dehydrogenase family)